MSINNFSETPAPTGNGVSDKNSLEDQERIRKLVRI